MKGVCVASLFQVRGIGKQIITQKHFFYIYVISKHLFKLKKKKIINQKKKKKKKKKKKEEDLEHIIKHIIFFYEKFREPPTTIVAIKYCRFGVLFAILALYKG